MRILASLLCALLYFGSIPSYAQTVEKQRPSLLGSNAEGLRFFVGFMQNEAEDDLFCGRPLPTHLISISSRYDAAVRIIFPMGQRMDTSVRAFRVTTIDVSMSVIDDFECYGEGVFSKGIEIIADRPVAVTSYNSRLHTSDGYLALPVSSWGQDYTTACYYVDHYTPVDSAWDNDCRLLPRPGQLAVLAAEDSTIVTVFPNATTLRGRPVGLPYRQVLNKGDIFQVQDGGTVRRIGINPGSDLTGSRVVASKPVGVLSGHVRTAVPNMWDTKDHLVEMIPPVSALGLRHMVAPFGRRLGGDIVRIISTSPSTGYTVTSVSGGSVTYSLIKAGDFTDIDLFEPTAIDATAPVLVVQYSRSTEADPRNRGARQWVVNFDPDMVVITPEEQFVNSAVFQTLPTRGQFDRHAVNVIVEKDAFPSLRLNGRPLGAGDSLTWGDVPSRPYVWATFLVRGDSIYTIDCDGLFGGYLYGTGQVDSYAWPIGSGLRRSIQDPDLPLLLSERECGGYRIVAIDSGATQRGLIEVFLDSTVSVNAVLEGPTVPIGAEMAVLRVRQINPLLPAFARIVARDLALNETSIEVRIEPSAVTVDPLSVDLGMVDIGRFYATDVTVHNPSGADAKLDSARLVRGVAFTLDGAIRDIPVPAGGRYTLTVRFRTGAKQTVVDTLVLWIDCREYRIPLIARSDVPGIATRDLDFDSVRVGRERRLRLPVWNTGYATLSVDSALISGAPFTISAAPAFPLIIAPGDTAYVDVAFRPARVGPVTGTVRFYSNVEDSVAIANLRGVGIYPNLWISDRDFGMVQVGDTLCSNVHVVNTGTDTATVTALDVRTPAGFVVDGSVFPRKLAPGDTLFVPICFVPTEEREYVSDILPRNEDDLIAMNAIRGRGYRLIASISGADMGRRWVNTTHDSVVYVTNHSTEPITVTAVWIEGGDVGDFLVRNPNLPVTLAPGDRYPVDVSFTPLQPGYRSCYVHAATSSRERPVVDSVLWGFGLRAMSSSRLDFDSSLAYACRSRRGSVVIFNDGNTPLTFASVEFGATPGVLTVNAPAPGYQIAVGDSVALDFALDLGGYIGRTTGFIEWTFVELRSTPGRHEFGVSSAPQYYRIAVAAPGGVSIGGVFNVRVTVDSAFWQSVYEQELAVRLRYDATILRFDREAWAATDDATSPWVAGEVTTPRAGETVLTFTPRELAPLSIADLALPPIPMQAFLGSRRTDTIHVELTAVGNECAAPAPATAAVQLDSICGLSERLMEFTGEPFALTRAQPNPAASSATFEFTLPFDAETRFELFNASGLLVRTMIDAMMAAGSYSFTIDVQELPSGVYYYRLTSGSKSASHPLHVAK